MLCCDLFLLDPTHLSCGYFFFIGRKMYLGWIKKKKKTKKKVKGSIKYVAENINSVYTGDKTIVPAA